MQEWLEKVEAADLEELDGIIEEASFDENITNEEYGEIYETAIRRMQER